MRSGLCRSYAGIQPHGDAGAREGSVGCGEGFALVKPFSVVGDWVSTAHLVAVTGESSDPKVEMAG